MTIRTRLLGAAALLVVPAAAQADLLVFDYSGFEDPAFHTTFTEKHGRSPDFAFFGDEDEAFQKLISGFRADVSHVCAGSVTKWVESGILEAWDTTKITAFNDLDRNLVGQDITAGAANVYFIPTDFGSTAIASDALESVREYPTDQQTGRIVGEVHLDHVPVDFQKQDFQRSSEEWQRAMDFLRGGSLLHLSMKSISYLRVLREYHSLY